MLSFLKTWGKIQRSSVELAVLGWTYDRCRYVSNYRSNRGIHLWQSGKIKTTFSIGKYSFVKQK